MTDLAKASFELNEEMLGILSREFSIQKVVGEFAQAIAGKRPQEIEKLAEEIFGRYGAGWIRRSVQLGDEYSDRTYEVLQEAIDSTGGEFWFPLIPQRYLEIAYLSALDMEYLPVLENNSRRLAYRVPDCPMFQAIRKECGEKVAQTLPCRHACLGACRTLFQSLGRRVKIEMAATTAKNGHCEFVVART